MQKCIFNANVLDVFCVIKKPVRKEIEELVKTCIDAANNNISDDESDAAGDISMNCINQKMYIIVYVLLNVMKMMIII